MTFWQFWLLGGLLSLLLMIVADSIAKRKRIYPWPIWGLAIIIVMVLGPIAFVITLYDVIRLRKTLL